MDDQAGDPEEVLFGLGDTAERAAAITGKELTPPAVREQHVFLHAGQIIASIDPLVIGTILGSCVAVCMWDAVKGAGGVNHFLLPQRVGNGVATPRYGNVAISGLISRLEELKSPRDHLRAKLFGGATLLGFQSEHSLGAANVTLARQLLSEARIPIVMEDVGGTRGRKLFFHTAKGTAWVRTI